MEAHSLDTYKLTAGYLVGSPAYRLARRESFLSDIEKLNKEELFRFLDATHMVSVFAEALLLDKANGTPFEFFTEPICRFQTLIVEQLTRVLNELSPQFSSRAVEPILLKGPALWGVAYKQYAVRRTRDIDLLIMCREDEDIVLSAMSAIGFTILDGSEVTSESRKKRYELGMYIRDSPIEISLGQSEALSWLRHRNLRKNTIVEVSKSRAKLRIEIEPHRALFLGVDGKAAPILDEELEPSEVIPGFRILTRKAQLPYLSTKFFHDLSTNNVQCMKLICDFNKLLLDADQREIDASIRIADRWHCSSFYISMLKMARELVPEVQMRGIDKSTDSIFENLARTATEVSGIVSSLEG